MLFLITTVTCLIVSVQSSYEGDPCRDGDKEGKCTPISQCQRIVDEIKAAGSPMPMHMRIRLDDIGCGFTFDEALICCAFETGSNKNKPDIDVNTKWGIKGNTNNTKGQTNLVNPEGNDMDDGPQDVTNHPNLRLLPKNCGVIDNDRIVGGNRTALYEMPWMVILSYDGDDTNTQKCGGTLINERYVLTAAHCVQLGTKLSLNGAILGEHDIRSNPDCEVIAGKKTCAPGIVNAIIEEVIPHPGYKRQALYHDIALLRLAEPANFSMGNIKPICLPATRAQQLDNLDGLYGVVAGWGVTGRYPSPVLMSVSLPIISNEECQAAYGQNPHLLSKQLCAGGLRDKDSCGGDSGGPLLYPGYFGSRGIRYIQRGVITFGPKRCGIGGLPGVYSRVSHYMKWILDNIRN